MIVWMASWLRRRPFCKTQPVCKTAIRCELRERRVASCRCGASCRTVVLCGDQWVGARAQLVDARAARFASARDSWRRIIGAAAATTGRSAGGGSRCIVYVISVPPSVAANPQSGLVTTSEVAIGTDDAALASQVDWSKQADVQTLLSASRAYARSAQNMGGR